MVFTGEETLLERPCMLCGRERCGRCCKNDYTTVPVSSFSSDLTGVDLDGIVGFRRAFLKLLEYTMIGQRCGGS